MRMIPARLSNSFLPLAASLAVIAPPGSAAAEPWYYVNMDTAASPSQQCVSLPSGTTPQASLAANAKGSIRQVGTDETKEGRLQFFASQSGSRYAFADTVAGCQAFRQRVIVSIEQRKLSNNADWLVADIARDSCEPLPKLFPAVGEVPAAHIPAEAERAAHSAGMQPNMKFLSPTFASLTVTYPSKGTRTFSIFAKKSECAVYLSGLREAMASLSPEERAPAVTNQRPGFGIYSGETASLKVGLETKPTGTALVVVNKSNGEFTFEPLKITLEAGKSRISPCTAHLLSLQGIGVASTVAVRAKATEGYILGACPGSENGGSMGSRLVIRQPITKVVIGGVEVRMHADP